MSSPEQFSKVETDAIATRVKRIRVASDVLDTPHDACVGCPGHGVLVFHTGSATRVQFCVDCAARARDVLTAAIGSLTARAVMGHRVDWDAVNALDTGQGA